MTSLVQNFGAPLDDSIDAEAAMQLSTLFRVWAGQALEMRWIAGESDRPMPGTSDASIPIPRSQRMTPGGPFISPLPCGP